MKKINYYFIALLITLGANADQRSYWSLSAGWAQPGDTEIYNNANRNHIGDLEFDAGMVIEGAIGNQISDLPVAYELAIAYQQNEVSGNRDGTAISDDATLLTAMANGYYLISCEQSFTPYGMVGIGVLDADIGVVGQDTVLAAQFGAGICYPLDDESCLSLEYRFFVAEDLQDEGGDIELDSQNFQIGYTRYY